MKKVLFLSLLSLMLFVACNKKAEEKKAEEPASAEEATNVEATATETAVVSEEVANPPAGCPGKTSVVVKSDEVGTVEMPTQNSWFVENLPGSSTLYFANYELDPKSPSGHEYDDDDAKTYINLTTKDQSIIKAGEWDAGKTDSNNTFSGMDISNKDTGRVIIGTNKKVTLTYVGTDYACGNINIDDGYGSIIGEFIAKYYKWGT